MTLALDPDDMLAVDAESSWSIERVDNNTTSVSIVPEVRKTSEGLRLGWGGGLKDPGMYEVRREWRRHGHVWHEPTQRRVGIDLLAGR